MNIRLLLATACLATAATVATAAPGTRGNVAAATDIRSAAGSPEAARWADSVMATLDTRARIGQLICGKAQPGSGADMRRAIRSLVSTCGVGSLLFAEGTVAEYAAATDYAQSLASVPVMMTFDGEWGPAMRIAGTTKYPANMALGAISDPRLLYDYGLAAGTQLRRLGIHVNYAPVLDVNSNPRNPVIGYRSFGADPARVAALGTAYARGLEAAGVLSVAKHFPGHGDTDADSHKTGVTVGHSRAQLDTVDLLPFRRYIDAGLSGVMVGHIAVPALDASGRPASLSQAVTSGLLRGDMGFGGLVFTDALEMKGARLDGHNSALEALRAGADILLCSGRPARDIDAIAEACRRDPALTRAVDEHCRRVLRYKYVLGLASRPAPLAPAATQATKHPAAAAQRITAATLETPAVRASLDALAAGAATVLRNRGNILPIGGLATNRIAVVSIGAPARNEFSDMCARYAAVDIFAAPLTGAALSRLRGYDRVIVAVMADDAGARSQFAGLARMPGLVAVFMVNPYKMNKFAASLADASGLLTVYDDLPSTRRAAAMAVFGGIDVSGRLPVDLPRIAPIGTGIRIPRSRLGWSSPLAEGLDPSLTDSIDSIVGGAIAARAIPGAQVLVARHGKIVHQKSYGRLGKAPAFAGRSPRVADTTLYDLASVSKATGTLPGIMKAVERGLLDLDAPVARYIPDLAGTDKAGITLRSLLYHESGMPPALDMYRIMMDTATYTGKLVAARRDRLHTIPLGRRAWGHSSARPRRDIVSAQRSAATPHAAARGIWVGDGAADTLMHRIYEIPLRPSRAYTYSCLNFCLLLDAEQRATGISHDRWVADSIWAPMGLRRLAYRPTERYGLTAIAPTEYDRFLRRQTVHGYVHDETAAYLGGVSGNAGLFGNAGDLAALCQMWLQDGRYGDVQVIAPEVARLFTGSKSPTCRRGLGFDKPDPADPDNSPTCDEASGSAYGHLGFTGTVFWVDPEHDLIFVFLTNRVNPTRDTPVFNRLNIRPALFSQVYRALRD